MRIAVIDIGSNTIKMTVYDTFEKPVAIYSKTIHARLSAHVENGYLSSAGIYTLIRSVNELKRYARNYRCKKQNIYAFATACIRNAKNRDRILHVTERSTKTKIDLLSGEKEGEICFNGALFSGKCPKDGILADLGGGSCEFISFENQSITNKISLNIGAVANYKKFVSDKYINSSELEKLSKYLENEMTSIGKEINIPSNGDILLTGGTARATANVVASLRGEVSNLPYTVKLDEIENLCQKSATGEIRGLLEEKVKERAAALACGVAVFCIIARSLGRDTLTVVNGGAREGYLNMLINKKENNYGNKHH